MPILSLSQAGQDTLPRYLLDRKGTYLDIGCYRPTYHNNSYSLELEGWTGLSVDYQNFSEEFNLKRKNPFLYGDVTTIDWSSTIQNNPFMQTTIDYISFDVDDATLAAVNLFPWDSVRFATMTIEHDQYRCGTSTRDYIRSLLTSRGYTLLCSDVIMPGYGAFEDWWVDMNCVDVPKAEAIRCNNTIYTDILKKMNPLPYAFYCPPPSYG